MKTMHAIRIVTKPRRNRFRTVIEEQTGGGQHSWWPYEQTVTVVAVLQVVVGRNWILRTIAFVDSTIVQ
jgi:hypothetical protein